MSKHNKSYLLLKWIVLLAAYGFLGFKLLTYNNYVALFDQWKQGWLSHAPWLIMVFLLLPLNWLLETFKWQFLLRNLEILSLKEAFRSVMIGNTAAFFTPNRLGEFPGRSISLSKNKRLQGITVGVLGSVSQTICIMLFGIPAALFFFIPHNPGLNNTLYDSLSILCFITLLGIYFFLPQLCKRWKSVKLFHRVDHLFESLTHFSFKDLVVVLLFTIVRYFIFCFQLYCILRFFEVILSPVDGIVAIATNYLFITFTPSLAFSEGAVRASVAVLVIGTYSSNIVGIAAAGLFVWLINFVFPMLVGSVLFAKKRNP